MAAAVLIHAYQDEETFNMYNSEETPKLTAGDGTLRKFPFSVKEYLHPSSLTGEMRHFHETLRELHKYTFIVT